MKTVTPVDHLPDKARLTENQATWVENLHQMTFKLSQAVPTFIDLVLKKADGEEKLRKQRVRLWTVLSYSLYPAGWALAFCGTLLEAEKKDSDLMSDAG
jgi:hypothetical protein